MATITLNNIPFTITDSNGEYFFQADTKLHHQSLAKAVRDSSFEQDDIAWYSPKHGNFSVKGDRAEFWTKMYMCDTVDEQFDLLFDDPKFGIHA